MEKIREEVSKKRITREHDQMVTDIAPVWDQAIYVPTGKPFDYSSSDISASALAEEIERITLLPPPRSHRVLICAWQVMKSRDFVSIFSLAQNVALLIGEQEYICFLVLTTEDYIYWKNGINSVPGDSERQHS